MDLLKGYDYKIIYHLDQGNVLVDALSRKDSAMLAQLMVSSWRMLEIIQDLKINNHQEGTYLA